MPSTHFSPRLLHVLGQFCVKISKSQCCILYNQAAVFQVFHLKATDLRTY